MGKDAELAHGMHGKHIVDDANPPVAGSVYHCIKAVGGDAVVTYTSKSGTVFTAQTVKEDSFDWDVYVSGSFVVVSGTIHAWLSAPVR